MRNLSETIPVLGKLDPASQSTSEKLTDAIPLKNHRRFLFIIQVGALGSSGTVDFVVKGATSSGGSYTTISGTAITQLTQAGSDDNKVVLVEVSADAIENLGLGYTHIKGSLTPGTAASLASVICIAGYGRYTPAADYDLAAVDEIVTLVN